MIHFLSLFSIVVAEDKILLGYLYSWEEKKYKISEAVDAGYSAIALAFGKVDGTTVTLLDEELWDGLLDIAAAKKKGLKIVVASFGGWYNTFIPDRADVKKLAANMIKFVEDYQLDGIDFNILMTQRSDEGDPNKHDPEGVGMGKDSTPKERNEYVAKLIAAIRAKKPDMIITCAPQVALEEGTGKFQIVNFPGEQMYEKAIQDCGFDYIMPILYNNKEMELNGAKQDDPAFISAVYPELVKAIPSKCKKTKLLIGMPSSLKSSQFSIFTETGKSKDKYGDMCNQFQSLKDESKFSGVMTWSVNSDPEFNFPKKSMYWKTTCPASSTLIPIIAVVVVVLIVLGVVLALYFKKLLCFSSGSSGSSEKKKLPMKNSKDISFASATKKKPRP